MIQKPHQTVILDTLEHLVKEVYLIFHRKRREFLAFSNSRILQEKDRRKMPRNDRPAVAVKAVGQLWCAFRDCVPKLHLCVG